MKNFYGLRWNHAPDMDLREAHFSDCDFSGADFSGVNFQKCEFVNCDFTQANLTGVDFEGAEFVLTTFERACLIDVDFVFARLSDANLRYANLRGARFNGADLRGVNHAYITLDWNVAIAFGYIQIGCQTHSVADWGSFSAERIGKMHSKANAFWYKHRTRILTLAELVCSSP